MKPNTGEKYKIRRIEARQLTIDHDYQRDPQKLHYRRIAENLDFDALGIFVVSERKDGSLVVIDGQHRLMALREQQVDEWDVLCRVYSDLSKEREAELYRELNRTRKTTAWDDFKAGLVQGDEECLAIQRIANRNGWEVSNQVGHGKVCCVSSLRKIFSWEGGGPVALEHALQDARGAWGDDPRGVERYVLSGLALLAMEYNGMIDRKALAAKLGKVAGGPAGILATAKQLSQIRREPIAKLCAMVAVQHYNRGRRAAGQLESIL